MEVEGDTALDQRRTAHKAAKPRPMQGTTQVAPARAHMVLRTFLAEWRAEAEVGLLRRDLMGCRPGPMQVPAQRQEPEVDPPLLDHTAGSAICLDRSQRPEL
jgi:hypothetical protein